MKMKLAENFLNLYELSSGGEEKIDFDNASLERVSEFVFKRISRKPPIAQAEMLKALLSLLMKEMKEMPQGERKILLSMKAFRDQL
jgi:hypothetical protein